MESKKRKVETFTRDLDKKIKKICYIMKGYPEGMTPKQISLKTGLNVNTVKSTLPKIKNVRKITRGFYKVLNEGDSTPLSFDVFDWNFHNLILTTTTSVVPFSSDFDFNLVKINIVVANGKATLRLSSDYPLNVSSICFVAGFFSDKVFATSPVMVSTVEFNRDFKKLRLDGVKSISVDSLVEQFKVYQKQRGLRLEHKTKIPLSVENIVDMLSNNPNSVDFNVKLSRQSEQLARLTRATERTAQLLLKLNDGLRGA